MTTNLGEFWIYHNARHCELWSNLNRTRIFKSFYSFFYTFTFFIRQIGNNLRVFSQLWFLLYSQWIFHQIRRDTWDFINIYRDTIFDGYIIWEFEVVIFWFLFPRDGPKRCLNDCYSLSLSVNVSSRSIFYFVIDFIFYMLYDIIAYLYIL